MKTKDTHIGAMRARYADNQRFILAAFGWDENLYQNVWLDMGRAFLDLQYPRTDAGYAEYHESLATDRQYWNWWMSEWKQKEDYFRRIFSGRAKGVTADDYITVMGCLLSDGRTVDSFFENYLYKLKSIINGSNSSTNKRKERQKSSRGITQPIC